MGDFGVTRDKWVCPNDRQLSLRAKLKVGWSVKTNSNNFNKPEQLNDSEQEAIMNVIRRAEMLDKMEQERVGRLVERLDNMKKNAMGNGSTQCILCADEFGILGASPLLCNDCRKAVCTKCGVDTLSASKEPLWLCKICAETRETWKKSGAWFYKGLPKYILPEKKTEPGRYSTPSAPSKAATDHTVASPVRPYNSWLQTKGRSGSEKECTDSSDEDIRTSRFSKRTTVRKTTSESNEAADSPPFSISTPSADTSHSQGPSPTHHYTLAPESPRSPQQSRETSDLSKSPMREVSPTYGKDRRPDPDRGHAPSGSAWYKPNQRKNGNDEDEYSERTYRSHTRKAHQSGNRHRETATARNEPYEDKIPTEESSKKNNRFYKRKHHFI